ncbi:hemin uptake protein HemP [Methylobacterium sp. J-078]|uniref:hemin uptake protein HemP n=1 Tax=Methylobacterium sp. J-078 TaxID=2836657 RepID=UPI001FB9820E|nr:hemin uptake protein HemP [Methylobacterium sp. J-078]MCJ2046202.1 hemin uptake protein HemP [Methylobacterium sp. J-078]
MSQPDGVDSVPPAVQEPAIPMPPAGATAQISSQSLLRGQREITILHGGDRYRLRITANDKLILTK